MVRPLGERHANVLIMGLGLFGGGLGAARFWAALGSSVTVTDLRSEDELRPSLEALADLPCRYVLGEHREEDFVAADVVVVNPAVKRDNPFLRIARENDATLTTEIATVLRLAHGPTFGVTGSNGKSTTAALLGHFLRAECGEALVGGNIGGSLLSSLRERLPSTPVVLELSSFQLAYLGMERLAPRTAVVTNLTPNHLDWHGDVEDYYEAKRNLLRFQGPEGAAILWAADPVLRDWAGEHPGRVGFFAFDDPDTPNAAFLRDGEAVARVGGRESILFAAGALPLPGTHNLLNALAAGLAARMHRPDPARLDEALSFFSGLPHRLETVATAGGITYVNDSIATTPEAAIAGLASFDAPTVLIAGGYDKGASFDELGRAIAEHAEAVVLIGVTAERIAEAVRAAGGADKIRHAETLEEAVSVAGSICPARGVVLLSPACASYDMFVNFEKRGEAFREIVKQRTPPS